MDREVTDRNGFDGEADSFAWVARLLQVTDSGYPTGAFAHSAGLEGFVQAGFVHDANSLERFVRTNVFAGLSGSQLPILRLSREAAIVGDGTRLTTLDELAAATLTPEELRLASSRSGRQRLDLLARALGFEELPYDNWERLTTGLIHTQLPVVGGIEAALLDIPEEATLQAFAFSTVSGVLSASLKLMRIGQTALQEILARAATDLPGLVERSREIRLERIGGFTPLLDIHSARHQRAPSRLFQS